MLESKFTLLLIHCSPFPWHTKKKKIIKAPLHSSSTWIFGPLETFTKPQAKWVLWKTRETTAPVRTLPAASTRVRTISCQHPMLVPTHSLSSWSQLTGSVLVILTVVAHKHIKAHACTRACGLTLFHGSNNHSEALKPAGGLSSTYSLREPFRDPPN